MHGFSFNVWEIIKGRLNSIICALQTCALHLGYSTIPRQSISQRPPPPNPPGRSAINAAEFGHEDLGHRAVTCAWASNRLGTRRRRRWSCRSGITFEVLALDSAKFTVNTLAITAQSYPWWGYFIMSCEGFSARNLTLLYG